MTTMQKNVLIVSLHFSPAHASHMIALGKLLSELGNLVTFLINEKYCSVANFSTVGKVVFRTLSLDGYNLAVFCNTSVCNYVIAKQLRNYGAEILYIFHEPDSAWNVALAGEGWKQALRSYVSSRYSIKMLRVSSGIILPSRCAKDMYDRNFHKYNSNSFMLPLLFDDEIGIKHFDKVQANKRYFGFIGSACKGHGIDEFLAFVKYALRSGSTIPFLIATKTDMSHVIEHNKDLMHYVNSGKIQIYHGQTFSNDKINEYYLQSFCVWNLYRRSTQSGVLPRAFMAGTPSLARRIGSFSEYVKEGVTGEFVDSIHSPSAILEAAETIRKYIHNYSENCRNMFLETFYYKANVEKVLAIIGNDCKK